MESCFLCRKHNGEEAAPPGRYIYEDEHWMVCHAPGRLGPLGTLFIESRRHFLDYSDIPPEESASLGNVMKKMYRTLRQHTDAERIYQLCTMEGPPHFQSWIVPPRKDIPERGLNCLARADSCSDHEASALTEQLRAIM